VNIFELLLLGAVLAVGYFGGRCLGGMYGLLGWFVGFILGCAVAVGAFVLACKRIDRSKHDPMSPRLFGAGVRKTTLLVLSIICGLIGTVALAAFADWRQWCCVNSWAMLHDTGSAVFLLSALAGYHLVSALGARIRQLPPSWPPGWLAHTAYVTSAVGTVWGVGGYVALGIVWQTNYSFMAIGVVTGSLGVLLKIRGRTVRQFDILMAGLIVSCFTEADAARAEWMMRHL